MRPERHPQGPRPPSYLCRAPHRRSRAARTRARRRRARRAASGAAAAAAPGGRACCSQAAARGPGRACSRRSPCAASLAAAAAAPWASATSRASLAAARRRLAAPSRRPPLAGPHEAGGGLSGPVESAAAGAGRGGPRGRGGGGASAAGHRRKRPARARSQSDPLFGPRGGAVARRESRQMATAPLPARPPPWLLGNVAQVPVGPLLDAPNLGAKGPYAMSDSAGHPLRQKSRDCRHEGSVYTSIHSFIHSVHHLLKARHMPDTVLGAGDAT